MIVKLEDAAHTFGITLFDTGHIGQIEELVPSQITRLNKFKASQIYALFENQSGTLVELTDWYSSGYNIIFPNVVPTGTLTAIPKSRLEFIQLTSLTSKAKKLFFKANLEQELENIELSSASTDTGLTKLLEFSTAEKGPYSETLSLANESRYFWVRSKLTKTGEQLRCYLTISCDIYL